MMAEILPDAETQVLDGVAHLAPMDGPEAFNKALNGFLTDTGY